MNYEYCVMYYDMPKDPHRIPPKVDDEDWPVDAEQWCREWVALWYEEAPNSMPGLFYVARRPVGEWERYDG